MAATNPFPGMNPWLESRWGDVHTRLISYAGDMLQARLPEDLRARMQERVFVEACEGPEQSYYPDVHISEPPRMREQATAVSAVLDQPRVFHLPDTEITEPFLEITEAGSGGRLITIIEFLSRSNKKPGPGRELYRQKQEECKQGGVNLVEIDLLRIGRPTTIGHKYLLQNDDQSPYHASVWRAVRPLRVECYPVSLRSRLSVIGIPLRETDSDAVLNLQELLNLAFERGRHDDLDYRRPLDPPLSADDATWCESLYGNHASQG